MNKYKSADNTNSTGVTEHTTSLLIEDFQPTHEGVYHFAIKTKEGVINHTVYKLVALQNVPVPSPVVMLLGYEFHLRVVFSQQPDQIHWYRVDAGVMVRYELSFFLDIHHLFQSV